MSKITFRADDDLIERLEAFDASKSEVMREALRTYLDGADDASPSRSESSEPTADIESVDELIAERVDAIIADRMDGPSPSREPKDVNVNINLNGDSAAVSPDEAVDARASDDVSNDGTTSVSHASEGRKTPANGRENAGKRAEQSCAQCGENLSSGHVYCPNCGEKASRRIFCDCGDELRSDWGFCPGCGRRTPAADVLDQSRSGANER
ncbi:double zinc ribbon domain-containing protein [Haloarcula marina]|uniref:double zinc ribbon domain-containing protein n=1 Tax=Haloarcula marina TaxID=2961574 RepID=UPI0020B66875|nr:zinc ribbon domain-containing protein [Halomicroarcula marina]